MAPMASKPVSRSPAADLAAELAELAGAPAQPAQPGATKTRRSPSRGKNRSPRGAAPGEPAGAEDRPRRGGIAKAPAVGPAAALAAAPAAVPAAKPAAAPAAAPAAKPAAKPAAAPAAKLAAAKPAAAKPAGLAGCLAAGAAPVAPAAASKAHGPVSSDRTFSCPDCGELFPSFSAQLLHQLASEPAHAPLAAEPTPVAAPAAGAGAGAVDGIAAAIAAAVTAAMTQGGVGAAGAPAAAAVSTPAPAGAGVVEQFAPKHGVRLLRNALDVAMIVPLLYAEPVIALDLEGDLTPGETQGVDLMQLYLPSVDLAPQHGAKCLPSLGSLVPRCSDAHTHAATHRPRGPRTCSGRPSGPKRSALAARLAAPMACAPVPAHRR